MFTFVTISYNQENIIIEHLESIKFLVEKFGEKIKIKYVLSDDGSTDSTVRIVEEWIKSNPNLFEDVRILTSIENRGIVANYIRGIQAVDTSEFKLLAGDDLYYRNNIFGTIKNWDLVFTPVIKFNNNSIQGVISVNHLLNNNELHNLRKMFKINNYFNAPGSLVKTSVIQDQGLLEFISKYKWREDVPTWYYILFKSKAVINIKINKKPYVLYRTSHGITQDINSNHDNFLQEEKESEEELSFKISKYPKYINPYRYYIKYKSLKFKYIDSKYNKDIIEANNLMNIELKKAPEHLNYIKRKALEFYKEYDGGKYGKSIIRKQN